MPHAEAERVKTAMRWVREARYRGLNNALGEALGITGSAVGQRGARGRARAQRESGGTALAPLF